MIRRFALLVFAVFALGAGFAAPAGATTASTTPSVSPAGTLLAGNINHGPVHKVLTQSLPASECAAVRAADPQASCTSTVTIDVRRVNGPQKAPAGAQITTRAMPDAADSSYWNYVTGSVTQRYGNWSATLEENVAYHNNCPDADCPDQGVVWNQWIDDSSFKCVGCTLSQMKDGVINNGKQLSSTGYLNGWEDYVLYCSTTGFGCNAGHGNRLYFRADGYWWGSYY